MTGGGGGGSYIYSCTMTRVKIKGATCSTCIYCENHRQTIMYTVAMVYGSYTLVYNFQKLWLLGNGQQPWIQAA